MMIVKAILSRALERLTVIEVGAPVKEAAALMSKPHTDLVVVCDHGEMVGVLTKTDISAKSVTAWARAALPGWTVSIYLGWDIDKLSQRRLSRHVDRCTPGPM